MKKQRKIIGIMMSEAAHHFAHKSLECIQREIMKCNMDVVTFVTLCKGGMEKNYATAECAVYETMNLDLLDGLVVCINTLNMPKQQSVWLQEIKEYFHKPVVSVEGDLLGYPVVPFREEDGMELLVKHLHQEHGITRMEMVSVAGDGKNPYHEKLERHFLDALEKYRLPVTKTSIHYEVGWMEYADAMVKELMEQEGGLPEALLCTSNESAGAFVVAFEEHGIHVPGDILVTGYNEDIEDMRYQSAITTVYRDPQVMAENVVRKLCNLMEGRERYPLDETTSCCSLIPGNTCGCGGFDVATYAKRRKENILEEYNGFESEYNFMSEDLASITDFEECLWTLNYYTKYLGDFEGFYLCLNENAMHDRNDSFHMTSNMIIALKNEGIHGTAVSETHFFNRKLIIPKLLEESEKPRVFYVASLHFVGRVLGYVVLSYGQSEQIYSKNFGPWMRKLASVLETQRRLIIYNDVTEENQIRDVMTGLYNYRGLLATLREQYEHYADGEIGLRVIALDISQFSAINENYGHDEGNEVLLTVSRLLQQTARDRDVCARLGNDEFMIAGFYERESDITGLMSEFHARLNNINQFSGKPYGIEVVYAKLFEPVYEEADIAAVISSTTIQKRVTKQKRGESGDEAFDEKERNDVIELLDDNLFTYHFQPIVSAKTADVVAYEALMRSGAGKKISPLVILKHAEALGRQYDVERSTFFNVLQLMKENAKFLCDRKLFINSIPKTPLSNQDFDKMMARYGVQMRNVVVEFTEQTEADKKQVEQIKERSRRAGFQMAIDDYGSGYSNVSNLLMYTPDYVKIDRGLISGIDEDSRKQYFVSNIIEFAHENGFSALAEGVETRGEMNTVVRLGIDLLQGFYLARPREYFSEELEAGVHEEIVELNLKHIDARQKKIYQISEEETMLMPLFMDGYTELIVSQSEVTLIGNPKMHADMVVRIPDNTNCRIRLRRVCLESYQSRPCIEIGNNCNVTLVIDGVVQLVRKGIRVPESSTLILEGEGKLSIEAQAEHAYAVGGDGTQTYGKIVVRMEGELKLDLGGYDCIGIGGGYQGRNTGVEIEKCRNLYILASSEAALGIGSYYGETSVAIAMTRIKIEMNSGRSVGIGSVSGRSIIRMKKVKYSNNSSGDQLIALGTLQDSDTRIVMEQCDIQVDHRAKKSIGIGCTTGKADVRIMASEIILHGEGTRVIGIGSEALLGRGHFEGTTFAMNMASADYTLLGYEPEAMSFLRCTTNW